MGLFEVAILEVPTEKEEEEGVEERLVFGPRPVIATDIQTAGYNVLMDFKNEIQVKRNRMRVLIRPFA